MSSDTEIPNRVISLAEEAINRFKNDHKDIAITHALLRGALGMLGAELHSSIKAPNHLSTLDDQDVAAIMYNSDALMAKVKHALLQEKDDHAAEGYLRSVLGLMGCSCSRLTHASSMVARPRDYDAAVSRFGDNSFISPANERGPSSMHHAEHAHPGAH